MRNNNMQSHFKKGGLMTIRNKYLDLIVGIPKRTAKPPDRKLEQSIMKPVLPSLTREDFLGKWQEDRKELEKAQAENIKLKKIMNTTWSKDWSKIINEKEKDKADKK